MAVDHVSVCNDAAVSKFNSIRHGIIYDDTKGKNENRNRFKLVLRYFHPLLASCLSEVNEEVKSSLL